MNIDKHTALHCHPRSHKNDNYPIWLKPGILKKISQWMPAGFKKIIIITDSTVKKLYAATLKIELKKNKYQVFILDFPAGEKSKSLKTYQILITQLIKLKINRDALIIALGGGITGDIAGFVAATYLRGIAYLQIPTTLLAMVDSSIGGKTGVNTTEGKNLIGAFWQPKCVIADVDCLLTLPHKQFINGLFEIIKIFLTCDKTSIQYFNNHFTKIITRDPTTLAYIIHRAIKLKINIVEKDTHENHLRTILNFGHTIGHAIEKCSHHKLLHGYAVGYGILVEAKIAELKSLLPKKSFLTIQALLTRLGITTTTLKKFNINEIITYTHIDKKNRDNKVQYVLLNDIGKTHINKKTYAHHIPDKLVKAAFTAVTGEKNEW